MSSYRPNYGRPSSPAGDPRYQQQQQPPQSPFDEQISWIMPKTVVQLAVWVLMFGLGAGLSGLLLFAFYQNEVNNLRSELLESQEELRNALEGRIDQLENAPGSGGESSSLSVSSTAPEQDLEQVRARLTESISPAIAGVRGFDTGFVGTNGSGFVVHSPGGSAWVVTDYGLVAGADPEFSNTSVRVGHIELASEVYEVDPGNGLALVIFQDGVSRSLRFAGSPPMEGDTVWAVGASRSRPYATLVEAEVLSVTPNLIVEAEVSSSFTGGPVVDERGRVLGIIPTLTSAGRSPEVVRFTVTPITDVCRRILRCPGGVTDEADEDDGADAAEGSADPPSPPSPAPEQDEPEYQEAPPAGEQQITG